MATQGATGTTVRSRSRRRASSVPEGVMEVERVGYESAGVVAETETIRVPKFEGPVAYVRVDGSVTRNMGDYNSIRVGVMVELPCYPTTSEVDRAIGWCSEKVDDKVARELRLAVGAPEPSPQSDPGDESPF